MCFWQTAHGFGGTALSLESREILLSNSTLGGGGVLRWVTGEQAPKGTLILRRAIWVIIMEQRNLYPS